MTFPLVATAPLTVGAVEIAPGDVVVPALLAANRDPELTPEPETLEVARARSSHVAFGYGIHYCIGAPLARLEGRIALEALLRRFPDMRLAVSAGELKRRPSLLIHGFADLPVFLGAKEFR